MINSISLKNFRNYGVFTFEFVPGVNILVGSSNRGKSTVFRALRWVLKNRPLGKSVVSYWNRGKKGEPLSSTNVSISVDGHTLERERNSDSNLYRVDGKELSAFKNDVPSEITSILNMDDLNLQEQDENGFIITLSPGEAAKVFNKALQLDVIDDCFSYIKKEKKVVINKIKHEKEEIAQLEEERESILWIEEASCLLEKLEAVQKDREIKENNLSTLEKEIASFSDVCARIKILEQFVGAEEIIEEIVSIQDYKKEKEACFSNLLEEVKEFIYKESYLEKFDCFHGANLLISEIEIIENGLNNFYSDIDGISADICLFVEIENKLSDLFIEIEQTVKQLPRVCPECGSILKGD